MSFKQQQIKEKAFNLSPFYNALWKHSILLSVSQFVDIESIFAFCFCLLKSASAV